MAVFVQIDADGTVIQAIVISDDDCSGGVYPQSEKAGQKFIKDTLHLSGTWLQTSLDGTYRDRYASVGSVYQAATDTFTNIDLSQS